MARSVLVTLADAGYLDAAKQLFACVHFDAGWQGDLLLLAHQVPDADLEPFRARGIQVQPCREWHRGSPSDYHPSVVLSKLYLFDTPMRRWEHVLYLDGDMMFWSSLERLARVRGLAAVSDRTDLAWQFRRRDGADPRQAEELARQYDLRAEAFNSGLLAFSTDLIRADTLADLQRLYLRYESLHGNADQGVLNLHFRGRWRRLPDFYAAQRNVPARHFFVPKREIRLIGRHFVGAPRPWEPASAHHEEWLRSLARFEDLDARRPRQAQRTWSGFEIWRYWQYLRLRRAFFLATASLRPAAKRLRRSTPVRRARGAWRRVLGRSR